MKNLIWVVILCLLPTGCLSFYDRRFVSGDSKIYLVPQLGPERAISKIEIKSVRVDSPAEKSGLKSGDEVVALNGIPVGDSYRKVFDIYSDIEKKRPAEFSIGIKRNGVNNSFAVKPEYDPSKQWRLGISYRFIDQLGVPLPEVDYVAMGIKQVDTKEASFLLKEGERARLITTSYIWGNKLVVFRIDIENLDEIRDIEFYPKNIVVINATGYVLPPLDTEAAVGQIYNVSLINSASSNAQSWQSGQAMAVQTGVNSLRNEFNASRLLATRIPPHRQISGLMVYALDLRQLPVTLEIQIGGQKLEGKFNVSESSRIR